MMQDITTYDVDVDDDDADADAQTPEDAWSAERCATSIAISYSAAPHHTDAESGEHQKENASHTQNKTSKTRGHEGGFAQTTFSPASSALS